MRHKANLMPVFHYRGQDLCIACLHGRKASKHWKLGTCKHAKAKKAS